MVKRRKRVRQSVSLGEREKENERAPKTSFVSEEVLTNLDKSLASLIWTSAVQRERERERKRKEREKGRLREKDTMHL